ncbi:MAG TPA: hypothetical protein VJG90_06835 [Candidatus Nanoarchaeia archaeon]|nr:hypothetical protein [Candidatus Nanoarchaeia archaeon]
MVDISQYEFIVKWHAYLRAKKRGVTPDMVEATLKGGQVIKFGKNNVKFIKEYKGFTVICVDEIIGTKIKIVTIEVKRRK